MTFNPSMLLSTVALSQRRYKIMPTSSIVQTHVFRDLSSTLINERWRFGLVGNVVGRINEVNQRWARLVLEWVTIFKTGKPSLYVTSHPGQLSQAIPPR